MGVNNGQLYGSITDDMLEIWSRRVVLARTVKLEIAKKYAGSIIGMSWFALQPILLLTIYLFVYLVVFKVKLPDFSNLQYVLFVFCGLVPYIAFMEGVSSSTTCIKQNMHLLRNMIMPISMIPIRHAIIAVLGQVFGLALIFLISWFDQGATLNVLWIPIILFFQLLLFIGISWTMASIGVLIPDSQHVISYLLLFLIFVSPIAFTPEMVPSGFKFIVYMNPVYYLIEPFRFALINGYTYGKLEAGIGAAMSVFIFFAGNMLFRRVRGIIVDHA